MTRAQADYELAAKIRYHLFKRHRIPRWRIPAIASLKGFERFHSEAHKAHPLLRHELDDLKW